MSSSNTFALAAAAAVAISCGLLPRHVSAFERTQTCDSFGTHACDPGESPRPIAWPVRCLKYRINQSGSDEFASRPDGTIGPQLHDIVRRSFNSWNKPSCSDLTLVEGNLTSNSRARYNDEAGWTSNMNLVVWRDDEWPYRSKRTFALTSVTYNSDTGRIADADIEINSATFDFTEFDESNVGSSSRVDLENTLTHEVGHFIGLDHPGNPKATMYGTAPAGEIKKRTLHQDDINGLCAAYPAESPPTRCQSPSQFIPADERRRTEPQSGCSVAAGSTPLAPLAVGLLAAAGVGWRRRRRRPDRADTDT
jgi:MYXO-CTERM domain-containing protein